MVLNEKLLEMTIKERTLKIMEIKQAGQKTIPPQIQQFGVPQGHELPQNPTFDWTRDLFE